MTHKQLVDAAYQWVLKRTSCGMAFKDFYTNCCNGERPDVIGFQSWGTSVLVECKASRSDFLSDRKKSFRANPQLGMGTYRFYCCPTGLLTQADLPEKWGLIYVNEKGRYRTVFNPYNANRGDYSNIWSNGFEQNLRAEHGVMYSALRRIHLRNKLDCIYEPEIKLK